MRVVALVVALVVSQVGITGEKEMGLCKDVSELAETVMDSRQKNVSMVSMMEIVKGSDVFESMVIDAYEQPAFQVPVNQEKAVAEFRDRWYLMCVKKAR
ncbi:hypothetical protein SAMN03080615_01633 [Amphritea atlantica]|uniref:Uncharacterized protein n=1 Tax=Amphritea atlantica TaxID=355243 RepID=A0A1H9GEJ6_9GAMM|nr:hypothetical protein [Amphritea atlantica]SEQ48453.1 hypothetical protein SAMN03080615_01633 [Amphritea atlantica]